MPHPVRAFAVASLTPVCLVAIAALFGGWWVVAALLYITVFAFCMDQLVAGNAAPAAPDVANAAANRLSVTLALAHFLLLALVVHALSADDGLGTIARVGLFFAAGQFFGQVSNSNAHELIHRSDRFLRNLGKWVYITLLFGHHASAHPKVHHRLVATRKDPNSAREGESFYAFAPRAWLGSFRAGLAVESADLKRRGSGLHPYLTYGAGAGLTLALAALIGGWAGLLALLLLAAYAQMQLLLSDYVQHYGLTRAQGRDGRPAPVGPGHSWNAPHWFSARLMLNAPRHSDHHAHPARPYPGLALPDGGAAPMLPYSLPAMATLALFPTLWRRVMGRSLQKWRAQSRLPA